MAFRKAVKHEAKLRLAIAGPSGSGKTYTSLAIATELGGKVAFLDTEHGSASKYADLFNFDVMELEAPFHPDRFINAISEAAAAGYSTIVLDSISHAWNGQGGLLELVEDAAKRMKTTNSYAAWRDITPIQNRFIEAVVGAPLHIIATMRSKQDYVQEKDDRTGRTSIRKVGMAPIQRDGFEYEFDVFLDMDVQNNAVVSKTRCPALAGKVFSKPGRDIAAIMLEWLHGAPAAEQESLPKPTAGNGNGHASPATPPAPAMEIPQEVALWDGPDDAYEWAVGIGASDNVHAARNAMTKIVEAHGGRFTKANAKAIYVAYYHDRMKRAREKAEQALDAVAADPDAVPELPF